MATKTKTSNTLSTYKTTSGNTVANKNTMTTSQIKSMQTALQKAGYNIGSTGADGIWGANTEAALSKWKSDNGVSNNAGSTIGQSNYNKLVGYTPTTTTKTTSSSSSSSGSKSNTSSGTNSNYLLTAGQTGSYADLANMAQAYLTGGTYTPNQTIDTNYWSTAGGGGKNALYNNTKDYTGKAFGTNDMAKVINYANLYQQQQAKQEAKSDLETQIEAYVQPYIQYYQDAAAQAQAAVEQSNTDAAAALQRAKESSQSAVNTAYDDTARKYYQLYKTQNAKLPENLSLAGVTGGASESAQLDLLNTYANNLYNNESGRNTQLASIDQSYNDKTADNAINAGNTIASNSISAANAIADAYYNLAQQKLAYDRQDAQTAAEQQAAAEEKAAAQKIEEYNTRVRDRMAKQLQKGDTIWAWADASGALHWTTYQDVAKANSLQYDVSELTPKDLAKVTSASSSSSSSSGSTAKTTNNPFDDSGSNGDIKDDYDTLLNIARIGVSVPSNTALIETTINRIKNSTLTEAEKKKILQTVGLL